jgi:hypothetical protein
MTQYAYYDHTQPAPQPVLGWYDTGLFDYSAALPAAGDLLELTADQWNARLTGLWAVSSGVLVAYTPPAPVLTIPQQAMALQAAGLAVTSTGAPSLNATYPCDAVTGQQVNAEVTSLLLNDAFTDGNTTIPWLDMNSTAHTFSIAQYKSLATAIAAFVTGCIRCINEQSTTLPSNTATIP